MYYIKAYFIQLDFAPIVTKSFYVVNGKIEIKKKINFLFFTNYKNIFYIKMVYLINIYY